MDDQLTPVIDVVAVPHKAMRVCGCCGALGDEVKHLRMGWTIRHSKVSHGSTTVVAMCSGCRVLLALALKEST